MPSWLADRDKLNAKMMRWLLSGEAYLDQFEAPRRALLHLLVELDDLDADDRERIVLADRAMRIQGPVWIVPGALESMQMAAEADIRRIWSKYHPDDPIEQVPPLQYRLMRYHHPKKRRFRIRR